MPLPIKNEDIPHEEQLVEDYFRSNFNTKLSKDEEKAFQLWAGLQSRARGKNIAADNYDYDIKGYWKGGGYLDSRASGHGPDTYKKPNHPTFSDESIYHGTPGPYGPWIGGKWGEGTYTPSKEMLRTTHDLGQLMQYFRENEKESKLILP